MLHWCLLLVYLFSNKYFLFSFVFEENSWTHFCGSGIFEESVQFDDVAQGTAIEMSVTNIISLKQGYPMYFLLGSDRLGNQNREPLEC